MIRRILGALLVVTGLVSVTLASPASATGDNNHHPKVWVCKYVGKPGVDERLKDGKQPIQVDSDAVVGSWFKDGQDESFVLDVVTPENTDRHNQYTGDKTCPTPENTTTTTCPTTTTSSVPVTSTSVPESTSTTSSVPTTTQPPPPESSTTTSVPPSSTTTTAPPPTTAPSTTTLPPTSTTSSPPVSSSTIPGSTTTVVVPTSTIAPPPPTVSVPSPPPGPTPGLAFTGSDTGAWLLFGFLCFVFGLALILSTRDYRRKHPWEL